MKTRHRFISAFVHSCAHNAQVGLHDAGATSSMDSADAEGPSPPVAAAPMFAVVAEAGRARLPARARTRFIMPHAEVDVCVRRAPCVCTESFLLLISSIGAAEPLLEAAVHHPRACAAARCVVGVLQASLFGASDRLLVLLRWSVAALGVLERCVTRVSAVTDGCRCALVGYGAGTARGPAGDRRRASRDAYLHTYRKT